MRLIPTIIGTGSYLPEQILSNADLEKLVDTSDEWILSRTGMKERRIAKADEATSDLGAFACKKALEDAKIDPKEIDLILCATCTPDYILPSTACIIQSKIGCTKAAAFDLQAACSGYIYALSVAQAMIISGMYKNILVVATEKLSTIVDYQDRTTCVLFGDGASAAVISGTGKGCQLIHTILGSDGDQANILHIPAGGACKPASAQSVAERLHYLQMDGKEVYKHAVRRMEGAAHECIHKCGLKEEDIDWLIPHQANMRIIESLAKRFAMPMEKVFRTIHKYGNTSASSVGIALDELLSEGKVSEGEHVLLVAFGAGLTWGATILKRISE